MADGIVSVFVEKLVNLMVKEPIFLLGVEHQLILFRDELEWIRSFLSEAQQKRRESRLVEVWVTQIIDLAYEAEDVIDAYILHKEQQRGRKVIQKMMHLGKKVKMLHQLGNRIEQINTRAQRISACRLNYDLGVSNSTQELDLETTEVMAYKRRGVSTLNEYDIVGLKVERSQLAEKLIDGEAFPSRKVISILGMGGLGKTTLARVLFNGVSNHFQAQIWLTVSEKYNARDLLLSALKQLVGENHSWAKIDYKQMEEEVYKNLVSKKYLVVIDDIWNVEDWERISLAFPNNDKGSRIMLTTRNKQVALHALTFREHCLELRLLDRDERWELFCRKVFSESGGVCPEHLVEVGAKIVEKCGGLPLAIVVIGGLLMGRERTVSAWSKVCDSAKWQLSQDSNLCRETLKLSYNHLPHYLKSCFLYLGLFPEDYEITADRLILLWVAEGFVQPRGEENMEDVAEDYLEELIQRSMILVTKRKYLEGPVLFCQIHDLLRDLAVSESRKDKFMDFHTCKNRYSLSTHAKLRRFAIHSTTSDEYVDQCCHTVTTTNPNMRTLFLVGSKHLYYKDIKSISFNGIKMLCVLDITGDGVRTLTKEIGSLLFLRYLKLWSYRLRTLPNSIGKLINLQTLDTRRCGLKTLPRTIWKLENLRHLHIDEYCEMSRHVGKLCRLNAFGSNLLTVKVGHKAWMRISDVVVKVGCLRSLNVAFSKFNGPIQNYFPLSLTHLTLEWSDHVEDPSGVLGSLPKLKSLVLNRILIEQKGEMVFSRQGFSQLEYLKLYYLRETQWRVEDGGLPSLRDLTIGFSEDFEKLPVGLRSVNSLQRITIVGMPEHFNNRVKENGEDWEIIKHVPIIDIVAEPWEVDD